MLAKEILKDIPDDVVVVTLTKLKGPISNLIYAYNSFVIGRDPSVEINDHVKGAELKEAITVNLTVSEQMTILTAYNNAVKSVAKPDSYETLDAKEERRFRTWAKKMAVRCVFFIILIFAGSMAYTMATTGETSGEAMTAILNTVTEIFKIIFSVFTF